MLPVQMKSFISPPCEVPTCQPHHFLERKRLIINFVTARPCLLTGPGVVDRDLVNAHAHVFDKFFFLAHFHSTVTQLSVVFECSDGYNKAGEHNV